MIHNNNRSYISQNDNPKNENNLQKARMSFAAYVQSQRQFGKEISNLSNDQSGLIVSTKTKLLSKNDQFKNQPQSQIPLVFGHSKSVHEEDLRQYKYKSTIKLHSSSFHKGKSAMEEESPPQYFTKPNKSPNQVQLYANEIFEYLKQKETLEMIEPAYMSLQKDISSTMRSILIDWLVDVHNKFKLVPQTLYLTVNLIDRSTYLPIQLLISRYLSITQISKSKLQLVGVSSLFIASKYEEIYAPELKDFVYVCDRAYAKEEILAMESQILQSIQFNLTHTSALRYLERQISGANLSDKVASTARMILELSLVDLRCIKFTSSTQSTSAILLALNLLESPQILPSSLYFNDLHDNQDDLKKCLQDFLAIVQSLLNTQLTSIKRKYSDQKYSCVSDLIIRILHNK